MKSIELLSIGIRLLGIYAILMALQTAVIQYQSIQQFVIASNGGAPIYVYVGILEVLLILFVSYVMIKFPTSLAKWLLPKSPEGEVLLDGSAKDIQTTLFCVLGVYILSWAIPDFFNNALWIWYAATSQDLSFGSIPQFIIQQIITVVELAVGVYLCIRSNGVSNLIYRLRTAGAK